MSKVVELHRTRTHVVSGFGARFDDSIGAMIRDVVDELILECEYEDLHTLTVKVRDDGSYADAMRITASIKDSTVVYDVFEQLDIARRMVIAKATRDADAIIGQIDSGEYEQRIRKDAIVAGIMADFETLDGKLQIMINGAWMDVAKVIDNATLAMRSMADALRPG